MRSIRTMLQTSLLVPSAVLGRRQTWGDADSRGVAIRHLSSLQDRNRSVVVGVGSARGLSGAIALDRGDECVCSAARPATGVLPVLSPTYSREDDMQPCRS